MVKDSIDWTALPRKRVFISDIFNPEPGTAWVPHRRGTPWEPGWRPHWAGATAPMMRSKCQMGDNIVVGPAYQYGANYLLYDASKDWLPCDIPMITRRIRMLMPAELQPG